MAHVPLFLLRIALGWLFFYAGYTKLVNFQWSAEKYLLNAATFKDFYTFLASPGMLPVTNALNEWALTLVGLSLMFGLGMRIAGIGGAILMILYYFPVLTFPFIKTTAFLIDEHIIYALALVTVAFSSQARMLSMTDVFCGYPFVQRKSLLKSLIS